MLTRLLHSFTHLEPALLITIYSQAQLTGSTHWLTASHYTHLAPALLIRQPPTILTWFLHSSSPFTHWLNSLAHSLPLYSLGSCTPHQTASHYTHLAPALLIRQPPTILTWLLHSSSDSLPLYPLAPALLIRQPPTILTGSCTPHQTASHYAHSAPALIYSLGSCTPLSPFTHWLNSPAQLTGSQPLTPHWLLHCFITIQPLEQQVPK